jgi:hypothetical protein
LITLHFFQNQGKAAEEKKTIRSTSIFRSNQLTRIQTEGSLARPVNFSAEDAAPASVHSATVPIKVCLEDAMLNFFMAQTAAVQFFMLLGHSMLVLAASIGCMHWLGSRTRERKDMLPVPSYFGSVTTVFALFLAFHASTIWTRQHAAESAFHDAVTAISRLDFLLGKEGLGLDNARKHLSRYSEAVVREEWATGNTKASPQVDQALDQLRQELIRASERVPTAFGNHLWHVFDDVVKARSARLWTGQHNRSERSWALVLFLGFLSHIAIAFVHIDRPSAGRLAITLFACATTACYWLLTRSIDPFAGLDTSNYLQVVSGSGSGSGSGSE